MFFWVAQNKYRFYFKFGRTYNIAELSISTVILTTKMYNKKYLGKWQNYIFR